MGTPLPSLVSEEWRADSSLSQVTRLPWTQAGVPTGPSPAALTAAPWEAGNCPNTWPHKQGLKTRRVHYLTVRRWSPSRPAGFLGSGSPKSGSSGWPGRVPDWKLWGRLGWSPFPPDCGPEVPVPWLLPAGGHSPPTGPGSWLCLFSRWNSHVRWGRLSALGLGERLSSPE